MKLRPRSSSLLLLVLLTSLLVLLLLLPSAQAFLLPLRPPQTSGITSSSSSSSFSSSNLFSPSSSSSSSSFALLSAPTTQTETPTPRVKTGKSEKLARDLTTIADHLTNNHQELLAKWVKTYTPLGKEISDKNFWRGDAMTIQEVKVTQVTLEGFDLHITVAEQGMFGGTAKLREQTEKIIFSKKKLPQAPSDILRILINMSASVGDEVSTASIYSIPVDDNKWVIPNTMFLNNVPHSKFARQFFYNKIVRAVDAAIVDGAFTNRMTLNFRIPESNPNFDSYRIGTILELIRELTIHQVQCGKRVKICVQQKMGTGAFKGLPISLNGCRVILENMDWGSEEGEENEGVVGTKVFFDEVGEHVVEPEDDVFILIMPQNIVGVSILDYLEPMAKKVGNRPLILLNPNLKDRPSANNVMQIKGREERTAFVNTFKTAFAFETLHDKGLFKIVGAVGKAGHDQPFVEYRLIDNQELTRDVNERREEYQVVRVTEMEPAG